MEVTAWRKEIQQAPDRGSVVGVVQRFTGTLTAHEREALPPDLMGIPKTPEEVFVWAFALSKEWLDSSGGDGPAMVELGKVSLVFAEASRRIAQLSTPRDSRPFRERWTW